MFKEVWQLAVDLVALAVGFLLLVGMALAFHMEDITRATFYGVVLLVLLTLKPLK